MCGETVIIKKVSLMNNNQRQIIIGFIIKYCCFNIKYSNWCPRILRCKIIIRNTIIHRNKFEN